jgi:hypothetical protein
MQMNFKGVLIMGPMHRSSGSGIASSLSGSAGRVRTEQPVELFHLGGASLKKDVMQLMLENPDVVRAFITMHPEFVKEVLRDNPELATGALKELLTDGSEEVKAKTAAAVQEFTTSADKEISAGASSVAKAAGVNLNAGLISPDADAKKAAELAAEGEREFALEEKDMQGANKQTREQAAKNLADSEKAAKHNLHESSVQPVTSRG